MDHFILVHGTFATGAPWTQPNSKLVASLRESFPEALIHRFEWSGSNSHQARRRAGDELSGFIQTEVFANGNVVIIAHSHGGNVALRAMSGQQVAARVHGLITLATPFIRADARDLDVLFKPVGLIVPIFAFVLTLPIIAGFAVLLVDALARFFDLSETTTFPIVLVLSLFTVGLGIQLFQSARVRLQNQHQLGAARQAFLREEITAESVTAPVVAAYVGGDEAALALGTFFAVGEAPQRIWPFIVAVLKAATWCSILSIFIGVILETELGYGTFGMLSFDLFLFLGTTLLGFSVGWAALMVLLPFLVRGLFVFGGETLFDNFFLKIYSSKLPSPKVQKAVGYPIALNWGLRLRHSAIYAFDPFLKKLPAIIGALSDQSKLLVLGAKKPLPVSRPRRSLVPHAMVALLGLAIVARGDRYMTDLAAAAGPASWAERYPELKGEVVSDQLILHTMHLPSKGVNKVVFNLNAHCAITGRVKGNDIIFVDVHKLILSNDKITEGPQLIESRRRRQHTLDAWLEPGIYYFAVTSEGEQRDLIANVRHVCWRKAPKEFWSWEKWLHIS